ncbi:MAG: 50S ribosomal protein L10 [Actinomycetota bacterium]|nr:50S ribosomal protein L10 [Actinomycetota bacterium]
MPRPDKVQAVAEIKERLERAQAVFLAEYAGLSVKQQQVLRRGLRESGAEFKVVKMTLARRAAAELELADLDELFLGPTGIAFTDGDPVTAAKALKDFAKENDALAIKGGLLGREFLSPERISELADIESREVLLSKIAGAMKAPMANLAGLLAALPRNMASAIQQLVEKMEEAGGGEPPVAEVESPQEEPEESAEEGETGDAVAAEESADDSAAEATEETEAPGGEAEESEEPAVEAKADGDDAKSVDEDPAEKAEEE